MRRLLFFDGPDAAAPSPVTPSSDYDIERIDATVLRGPEGADRDVVKLRLVRNNQSEALFKEEGRLSSKVTLPDPRFWGYHKEYEVDPEPLGPFKLTLANPLRRSEIKGFEIHFEPGQGGWKFSLRGLKVTVRKPDGQEDVLVDESSGRNFVTPGIEPFGVTVPKPPEPSNPKTTSAEKDQQASAQRAQDLGLAWELTTHLYDHRDTYGPRLVALKEPMWLAEALDWAMGRGAARDNIDSVPVAISGQHIVFAYHGDTGGKTLPPATEQPAATIVSLPTRGVLAEAQLGNCNACEKRDVTRFWKWEESPCEQAPAIEGITPGFRGQPTNVEQGQLPNAVVQITQPPAAPDPVGLAAALNLLGKGDAFRDMSGLPELQQLLSGLASGAVDLVKAKQLAQQVQAKQAEQNAGANSGGDSGRARTPEQRYDNLQVVKAARDDGLISTDDARAAALDQVGVGGDRGGVDVEAVIGSYEPLPHPGLAVAAKQLGDDAVSMESYQHFQGPGNGDGLAPAWGWFFSPNTALEAAAKKPAKFDSWADWHALSSPTNRERTVIADLAGFDPAHGIPETPTNLAKLKAAFAKWPDTKVAAFLRGNTEASNTCNVFLGDSLYMAGLAKMRVSEAKYFSAAEVFTGNPPFYEVSKAHVRPGDIAAFGGSHVEIVTSVTAGLGGPTFCSRGGYRAPMGQEKCTGRVVSDSSIRFMRVIRSGFQI